MYINKLRKQTDKYFLSETSDRETSREGERSGQWKKRIQEITEGPRKVGRQKSNINSILIILLKTLNYPYYKYYLILPFDK